jgi:hypothetical protein
MAMIKPTRPNPFTHTFPASVPGSIIPMSRLTVISQHARTLRILPANQCPIPVTRNRQAMESGRAILPIPSNDPLLKTAAKGIIRKDKNTPRIENIAIVLSPPAINLVAEAEKRAESCEVISWKNV